MLKLKTRKGAAKRFKLTATGKVRYKKANSRHILTKKSRKRKRNLTKSGYLNGTSKKIIKKTIPYS